MTRPHVAARTLIPLSLLDEHFLNLDHLREPWGVHLEVHVGGHVNPQALAEAIVETMRVHPMTRARLAPCWPAELVYHWEIVDGPERIPLAVVDATDQAELAAAREELYAVSPALGAAPPFSVLLARGPEGDSILLNLHHAVGDGVAALRLMRSLLRAYAGEVDPVPPFDPLAARDVLALTGPRSFDERLARRRALMQAAARRMGPIARIVRNGGDPRPGYGFELMALSAAESAALFARRDDAPATVNDVLVAGLAVAIRRWNAGHGRRPEPIALTMPVNIRPPAWREEVIGNFATYVTVWLSAEEQRDPGHALAAAAERTRQIKDEGLAGSVVDLLVGPSLLPVAAKRHLQDLIPMTGNRVVDTASLSNLGRAEDWPAVGSAAESVDALWFSPPARTPLGAAIGAATVGGRLHVTIRYPHGQFGLAAARAFADLLRDVLVSWG